MEPHEVLELFRNSEALLKGHFELRSGLHSDQYFQCAMVLRYPRVTARLVAALADKMKTGLGSPAPLTGVIAPAMGGILVGYELARTMDVLSVFAEKEEGKLVLRRGFEIRKGERYLVGEDVITRGGRVQETIHIVEEKGADVVAVAVLVDRSGGKVRFNHPTFSLLELEPVTWTAAECPLCRDGVPLTHPGS